MGIRMSFHISGQLGLSAMAFTTPLQLPRILFISVCIALSHRALTSTTSSDAASLPT